MNKPFETLPETAVTIRVDPEASVAPIRKALTRIFDTEQVSVTEGSASQAADVAAVRDGRVVATSPADALMRSLLLINSDVYITGSRDLDDARLPAVLQALHDIPFQLRGYPESDSEKLLLIVVSRAIERRAAEIGAGTLRVGFQTLSRLVEEPGTYRVYQRLADTDLAVHAYGVGDVLPPDDIDLAVHTGTSQFYRKGWFVVFEPPTADGEPAGLYAVERSENEWDGFWTFEPARVDAMEAVIAESATTQPQ